MTTNKHILETVNVIHKNLIDKLAILWSNFTFSTRYNNILCKEQSSLMINRAHFW